MRALPARLTAGYSAAAAAAARRGTPAPELRARCTTMAISISTPRMEMSISRLPARGDLRSRTSPGLQARREPRVPRVRPDQLGPRARQDRQEPRAQRGPRARLERRARPARLAQLR